MVGARARAQVHALDLPGHGLTGQPLDVGASVASASAAPSNWDFVGESIRRSAEQLREDTRCEPLLIGVGHSLGGAGCLLAELQSPAGLFDSLLVWEPILFDPSPQAKRQASGPDKAKASSRRRADFDSPQQALESFATKPLFADWDPRSLEGYIDGGLRPKDSSADVDGGGWTLCCAPKVSVIMWHNHTCTAASTHSASPTGQFARGRNGTTSTHDCMNYAGRGLVL